MASVAGFTLSACEGPVGYTGQAAVRHDLDNLQSGLAGTAAAGSFMSAASPGVIAVFSPNRHYASYEEYVGALADAMREEYQAIHDAGVLLQLDCADLAMIAPEFDSLAEFRTSIELAVEALNHAVAGIPAEAMRMHVCWGNTAHPHAQDVPLADIIDILLRARPAGLMLMASNGRHAHEWKVFRDARLPDGKYLIPGVIDPTTNIIEHPEVIADRLIQYAGVVGRERVMAGTDCGFDTIAGLDLVAPSVMWAKFRAQAEGAAMATQQLWA